MHETRGRVSERKKLYFNKHFSILYVYDHLEIYAWILKENLSEPKKTPRRQKR
jgi:hypothetical protein